MSPLKTGDLVDELARIAEIVSKQAPVGLEKVEAENYVPRTGTRYVAEDYDWVSSATISGVIVTNSSQRGQQDLSRRRRLRADLLGTLIGLVQMFANMIDLSNLATSLFATLYSAVLANLFCLPIATSCTASCSTRRPNAP